MSLGRVPPHSPVATMLSYRHMLLAIATMCWLGSTGEPRTNFTARPAVQRTRAPTPTLPEVEKQEVTLDYRVETPNKYAALLDQLPPLTAARLQPLFAMETSDLASLATREREISLLLSGEEYALYEQLRESANIQAHLQTFAEQIESTYPLHPEQRRALLLAKLKHSDAAQLLTLEQTNLPAMEGDYARDVAVRGIEYHQLAFLEEMRPVLTNEQWQALADFERAAVNKLLAPPGERTDMRNSH